MKMFSRDELILDHHKAAEFLAFMSRESFGVVPFDWEEMDSPSIQNIAVDIYCQVEREMNALDYMRTHKFEPH